MTTRRTAAMNSTGFMNDEPEGASALRCSPSSTRVSLLLAIVDRPPLLSATLVLSCYRPIKGVRLHSRSNTHKIRNMDQLKH